LEVLSALDSAPALKLDGNTDGSDVCISGPENDGRIYVASVSPQTRASIAATYGVSECVAGYMIEQLLSGPQGLRAGGKHGNGFEWVLDTNVAREACLVLGVEEVMASIPDGNARLMSNSSGTNVSPPTKPILTSSCPGWICYAEKTHPHILPHLSRLKSPQALMGTLLKTTLSRKLGISPDRIWHVAVMPCFDKKLEASREELTDVYWGQQSGQKRGVRDVDCVITSKEILMLAATRGINFAALPHEPLSATHLESFPDPKLRQFLFPQGRRHKSNGKPVAGTSGGNLYYILEHFSSQHLGSSIQVARGRNSDVVEYTVTSSSGEPILRAAKYYGFRNIQNLVRRLKPAKSSRMPGGRPMGSARKLGGTQTGTEYAYVEVMACPGGCTNGGGQIKVDDPVISGRLMDGVKAGPQAQKEWLAMVDEAYFSGEESNTGVENHLMDVDDGHDLFDGIPSPAIKETLAYWSSMTDLDLDRLAYTSYRAVVSDVGKDKVGHTERVVELAGKIGGGW
jgi:iron only hydrogenase large subunit-like protein